MYGLEMLVFQEGGKPEYLYPQNKAITNKPHMIPGQCTVKTQAILVGGKCSHHYSY